MITSGKWGVDGQAALRLRVRLAGDGLTLDLAIL